MVLLRAVVQERFGSGKREEVTITSGDGEMGPWEVSRTRFVYAEASEELHSSATRCKGTVGEGNNSVGGVGYEGAQDEVEEQSWKDREFIVLD